MVAALIAISVMYYVTVKLAVMVANATYAVMVMDAVMVAAIVVAVDATVVEAAERVKQR